MCVTTFSFPRLRFRVVLVNWKAVCSENGLYSDAALWMSVWSHVSHRGNTNTMSISEFLTSKFKKRIFQMIASWSVFSQAIKQTTPENLVLYKKACPSELHFLIKATWEHGEEKNYFSIETVHMIFLFNYPSS